MQRGPRLHLSILTLAVVLAAGAGAVPAGDGSVVGAFAVNNELPAGWALSAVLRADGSAEALASHALTADGSSLAFSFAGLEPGSYKVRDVQRSSRSALASVGGLMPICIYDRSS
jgi:hypothetical protein